METSSRQRVQPRSGYNSTLRSFGAGSKGPISRSIDPRLQDFGNTPPRPMGSWRTAGPGGNAQQAGSSVMAGRKLLNRNLHPSKMPANTTRSFPDVPANTPGKIFASSFRSGLANGHSSKFTFSPRMPHNTMRESFPTVTPGRSFRGASADMAGRGMSNTTATNLFQMRIASPPPELDGEELAKQVPESSNRIGSIYADEFLSHLVPPELDDLQRRQFLCILDLRRLKYAANEIFAKKDWRVNIMNFAKEYEKSRSLIMLRYGLYEFKTVPASREILKKWKQENNVPDEDEEMEDDSTPKSNGTASNFRASTKRRAEDDLTKDASSKSFSAQNKRRLTDREPLAETAAPVSNAGATPVAKKTKRGSEQMDQDDENQPSKVQKSKQSATRSLFEEVANNTPAKRAASPPKPASKSLFGDSTASKPQSSLFAQPSGPSVLGGASKATGLGGNIFGHLSDQNTPMGSDDEEQDDAEGESDNEMDKASTTEKATTAAPTFGNSTASLFGAKAGAPSSDATSSLFGAKATAASSGQSSSSNLFGKGSSLMDRATNGSGTTGVEPSEKRPASPPKPSQPQNNTWNPNTPIKFGTAPAQTSTPLFGASTAQSSSPFSKPSEAPKFTFGATETPKPSEAPSLGISIKDFAKDAPKASAPSLFGQAEKPSETTSKPFGNSASLFGKPNEQASSGSAALPSTPSLFGSKSQTLNSTTPFGKPAETPGGEPQSKSLFGGLNAPGTSTQSSGPSLFGANNNKPANSLFGNTNGDKPAATPTLFGASSTTEEKEESAAKRKKADFGATEEQSTKKYVFGGNAPTPAEKLPPKTAAAAKGATDAASVFGAPSVGEKKYTFGAPAPAPAAAAPAAATAPAPAPTSLFGNPTAAPAESAKAPPSIFASTPAPSTGFAFGSQPATTPTNPPSNNLFGGTSANNASTNQSSGFSFGNNAPPAPGGGGSFTFNAGGGDASFNNPFASGGNASQPPSFDFGTSTGQFQFGGSTPAVTTSSFTFGAGSQPANDAPAPSNNLFGGAAPNGGSSMFSFGGASQPSSQPAASGLFSGQPANAAQGIFASQLAAPPAGSSTGTSKY